LFASSLGSQVGEGRRNAQREPAECKNRQNLFNVQEEVRAVLPTEIRNEAEFQWRAALREVEKG
jgi:hypothetical protein